MFNPIGAYVIGLPVLSFWIFKTYFNVRAVWKQYGWVCLHLSRNTGLAELGLSAI